MKTALEVLEPGWVSNLTDLGRRGSERLGVATSGASDQYSAEVANILVANPRDAVLLEVVGARFRLRAGGTVVLAVTGAPSAVTIDGVAAPMWRTLVLRAGSELAVAAGEGGLRTYLAVHGALATGLFLGSAAPDPRMGFPQRLAAGQVLDLDDGLDELAVKRIENTQPPIGIAPRVPDFAAARWTIDITEGPETAAVPGIAELLANSTYTVGPRSDHIGLRLDGPVLHPQGLGEITSHGVPIGSVEIPHSDELIILGRARSLTAGYPIVAVATSASLALLGQAAPGRRIAFRWTDLATARDDHRERRRELRRLEQRVRTAFGATGFLDPGDGGVP
ncbi:5-oxoprolinase subunit C family protein [Kineococcus sp. SYSU DK003]|uniref:5-oxoprolinase subunit C family protein n=1 Tax=Kineococcus sp. SYSU DK003 TaxID=3383124 RepID=UPI003D7EEC27